jgi:hypothetical protein
VEVGSPVTYEGKVIILSVPTEVFNTLNRKFLTLNIIKSSVILIPGP